MCWLYIYKWLWDYHILTCSVRAYVRAVLQSLQHWSFVGRYQSVHSHICDLHWVVCPSHSRRRRKGKMKVVFRWIFIRVSSSFVGLSHEWKRPARIEWSVRLRSVLTRDKWRISRLRNNLNVFVCFFFVFSPEATLTDIFKTLHDDNLRWPFLFIPVFTLIQE